MNRFVKDDAVVRLNAQAGIPVIGALMIQSTSPQLGGVMPLVYIKSSKRGEALAAKGLALLQAATRQLQIA